MNFHTIYGNGCSFMWGHHHNNPWLFKYFEETKYIDISKFLEECKNHDQKNENTEYTNPNFFQPFNEFNWVREKYNYLNRVSEEFDFKCINESMFGGSLDRVFRKTFKYITETNDDKLQKTIFVLEIPPPGRGEIYFCNENRYCSFAGNENFDFIKKENFDFIQNWYDKSFDLRIQIISEMQKLYLLINLLKSKNLKFYFVQTSDRMLDILYPTDKLLDESYLLKYKKYMEPFTARKIQKEIDNNSIKFYMHENDFTYNMIHWVGVIKKAKFSDNTDGISFDGHPSFTGSKLISEKIIECIKNNF